MLSQLYKIYIYFNFNHLNMLVKYEMMKQTDVLIFFFIH